MFTHIGVERFVCSGHKCNSQNGLWNNTASTGLPLQCVGIAENVAFGVKEL